MGVRNLTPLMMTALMLLMSWSAILEATQMNVNEAEDLALETEQVRFGASDPGHVVFAQYITSDNCPYCSNYGSPAHHKLKTDYPERYVYISYQSVSYGDTDTARAGNVNPYNWSWSTSGAPDAYFGDRLDKRKSGCGTNTCYDTEFSSGGGMTQATTSQYTLGAGTAPNGANIDITISAQYTGTGTPPNNVYLYSALTEELCTSYPYTNGYKGHNCWKAWLTSSGTYKSNGGGSGTAFNTVSLAGGSMVTFTWSVPASLVDGGASNALIVAALMEGAPSTGASNEHVLTATDSSMNPRDLSVTDFTYDNLDAPSIGFQSGDMLKLEATIGNTGNEDYSDGGQIQFYEITANAQENSIGSPVSLNNLNIGQTQTVSAQFDTTAVSMDPNDPQTAFRVKLTGTQGERDPVGNNMRDVFVPHDIAPTTSKPIATGTTSIPRGATLDFEVTGISNDNVDTLADMTAEMQTSTSSANQWTSDWVSGGTLMGAGTSNARFVFTVSPPSTAGSGDYDVRARLTDARGNVGEWSTINTAAFSLQNGLPMVVTSGNLNEVPANCPTYPGQPTVKVETTERIPVAGLICDAETPLDQLVVSSNNPAFLQWDAAAGELEVRFNTVQRNTQGEAVTQPLQVTIDDGEDTNSGTLNIMVIENGAPRWSSLPTQSFEEGGGTSVILTPYLTDTDSSGNSANPMALALSVEHVSNASLITAEFNGHTLNMDAVDGDVFGTALITVRAMDSDGQYADTELTVVVANVNDAPTLDTSLFDNLRIKVGEEFTFDVVSNLNDVDDPVDPLYVTASCDTWKIGSRYNPLSGEMKAWFEEDGVHTITIVAQDAHDATNVYDVTVEVIDSLPLIWSENAESGDLMASASDLYILENPTFTISEHSGLGLSDIAIEWSVCNIDTGVCTDFGTENPSTLTDAYNFTIYKDGGMLFKDQVKMTVTAIDSDGFDRKTALASVFDITEERASEVVDDNSEDEGQSGAETSDAASGPGLVIYGVIGAFIIALLVALVLGLMLMRGGREDDFGMGYGSAPLHDEAAPMPPQGMAVAPTAMVSDYTQLTPGGNYITNEVGQTVYLSPDNSDWTMQPDNSFIRTR